MSTDNVGESATAASEGIDPDLTSTAGFEDLDEDRLGQDPLEEGMDPPEDWSASDRTGTTAREQREGESLDEKLDQEIPDPNP